MSPGVGRSRSGLQKEDGKRIELPVSLPSLRMLDEVANEELVLELELPGSLVREYGFFVWLETDDVLSQPVAKSVDVEFYSPASLVTGRKIHQA